MTTTWSPGRLTSSVIDDGVLAAWAEPGANQMEASRRTADIAAASRIDRRPPTDPSRWLRNILTPSRLGELIRRVAGGFLQAVVFSPRNDVLKSGEVRRNGGARSTTSKQRQRQDPLVAPKPPVGVDEGAALVLGHRPSREGVSHLD